MKIQGAQIGTVVGNWTGFNDSSTSNQSRGFDARNEITSISGGGAAYTPTFDANGNMTMDEQGHQFVYDAWNRIVTVKDHGGTTLETYTYDALGRRVTVTAGSTTTDLYYNTAGNVIEERQSGAVTAQQVWGLGYVNALVLRDRDYGSSSANYGTSSSGLNERFYVQQDANWNETALIDTSGAVKQRFVYTPYGVATVIDGTTNWSTTTDSYSWVYTWQGGRLDSTTAQIHFGDPGRDYSPSLGRWVEQDPAGYVNGANLYQALADNPVARVDPSGLAGMSDGAPQLVPDGKGGYNVYTIYPPFNRHLPPPAPPPPPNQKRPPLCRDDFFFPSSKLDYAAGNLFYNIFSSSPFSGFYVFGGPNFKLPGGLGAQVGGGFTWDIDNGYYFGAEGYAGPGQGNTFGAGGGWTGYSQDSGFDPPFGLGNFGGFVGAGNKTGGGEVGISFDRGTTYIGVNLGVFNSGAVINNRKLLDAMTGKCSCPDPYSKSNLPTKIAPGLPPKPPTLWNWMHQFPGLYPGLPG